MTKFRHIAAALGLSLCLAAAPAHAEKNILFIVDASGSMKKSVDQSTRMNVAKKVLGETLASMPADAQLGLLVYGHRKAKDCSDIELVDPIGSEDAASIRKTVEGLAPKGETPIADSLRKAAKSFKAFKGQQNSIILVTDGIEECKGDPCAAAQELKDAGLDVKVNIVGFTLSEQQGNALKCVSDLTGGKYYSADNAAGLTDALKEVQKQVEEVAVVQTAQPPKNNGNLLDPKNGGTLVYAPRKRWADLTHDTDKFAADARHSSDATFDGEAVWSFKDGRPAIFDQIEVLVPGKYQYNLKDFEVLAADELAGPYKSLGEFTTLDTKVQPAGWQAFKFPETTAKFVKVVFKTDQGGGHIEGNPLRLQGKIDETAPAAEKPPASKDPDLLDAQNGGTLVFAPNDRWADLTRNVDQFYTNHGPVATYDGEAVWSFKDGKPARFDRIEVLAPSQYQYNLKDFEVLAADELNGSYRSLGVFSLMNARFMPDGWQTFTFPETTAKFVKVVFKTDQSGGHIEGNPLRLPGKIDDTAPAVQKPAAAKGADLLAAKNGGTLVYAPSKRWADMTHDPDNFFTDAFHGAAATYDGEAVWSFKDGKPASFDRIELLVPGKYEYGLKDFEVLAADDLNGPFNSLGSFTIQNARVLPDGWQTFTFPETKAKFVKVVFKTDQGGGHITGNPLRLIGTVDDSAPAAAKAAKTDGTDLLAAKNGGALMASPNDGWASINDGKTDSVTTYDGEGVWAFKDEKPAMIEAVEVVVPGAYQYNLKDFEVLVGDDGPTGKFHSLGTFTVQNAFVMPDGVQRFTFPKAMAKYVKLAFKTDQGGGHIAVNDIHVIGKMAE